MTILYEPVCHGAEHAPFNAAMLTTVLEAFPHQKVSFFSEPGHAAAVRELVDRATARNISWRSVAIAPRSCRDPRARLPFEWRVVSEVLRTLNGPEIPQVVACAVTHAGLAALQCQLLARARSATVAVVHHSGLASTLGSRSTQALLRWTAGGRLRHVVLGDSIHRAVADRLPASCDMRSMRHPYLFPETTASPWPAGEPLRFGFLGLASVDKGFDRFSRLANRVSRQGDHRAGRLRFELVGRLDAEIRASLTTLDPYGVVEIGSDSTPMPREEYEQSVGRLTYAVLPYRQDHALASSGAILDAFAQAKPCIALRTPLFEEYFSAMGDIGYLCQDEQEMTDVVSRLAADGPGARYASQRRNIINRREIFSPNLVAAELRRVLENCRQSAPEFAQTADGNQPTERCADSPVRPAAGRPNRRQTPERSRARSVDRPQ